MKHNTTSIGKRLRLWKQVLISSFVFCGVGIVLASNLFQVGVFDPKTLKPADQGDLFVIHNGKPQQRLTTWGANFVPVISRSKHFLVYRSETQVSLDNKAKCVKTSCGYATPLETNLYLLNLGQLKIQKLTFKSLVRSNVVWSANSTAFAWLENRTGSAWILMMYTIGHKHVQQLLDNIPLNGGEGAEETYDLKWTSHGILIAADPEDDQNLECFLVGIPGGHVLKAKVHVPGIGVYNALASCIKAF